MIWKKGGLAGVFLFLVFLSTTLPAITSIGYPATVVSESEIDETSAFSVAGIGSGGCCGSRRASNQGGDDQDQGIQRDDNTTLSRGSYSKGGCCSLSNRPVWRGGCGGSSSAWQELRRRLSE